jgi:hypothetical protein
MANRGCRRSDFAGIGLREAGVSYSEAIAQIERAKLGRERGETPSPDLDPAGAKSRSNAASRAARIALETGTAR